MGAHLPKEGKKEDWKKPKPCKRNEMEGQI
jgi:hypothetical protein